MKSFFSKPLVIIIGFVILFGGSFWLAFFLTPIFGTYSYTGAVVMSTSSVSAVFIRPTTHINIPDVVKGIYMTACTASSKTLREKLVILAKETEINSIVIDIKDYTGEVSYKTKDKNLSKILEKNKGSCFVSDMQNFVDELHENGIYVIGRVSVFQDKYMVKIRPDLAVKKRTATTTPWKDRKGISWIDAGAKEHWDYIVSLARDAWNTGFDEINFDYIRFPSDGDMSDIYYPFSKNKIKADVMESFFAYLNENLSDTSMKISADLFGMTMTNRDDLSIGQVLEKAIPYFDFVDPMVYPSHYSYNFNNLGDPNKHPYEVVDYSMEKGVARTIASTTPINTLLGVRIASTTPALYTKPVFDKQKIRPWLQDFDYPVVYTPDMVRTQIQATYDNGLKSWILWNPSNRYTRSALLSDIATSTGN